MRIALLLLATLSLALQVEGRFIETLYPAWTQTFQSLKTIHHEKSNFWDLLIFENPVFGKVLAIDGIVQTTEKDEPIYHEMIVHVPLLTHGKAKSVLILGGGDGGSLRETLRHKEVEKATLVEIDRRVMDLCKRYMPSLSNGAFEDPRALVVIQDAAQFVKETRETYDVIICDSCDPLGPGKALFTSEFYGDCKALLNPMGIFVNQAGVPFIQSDELKMISENMKPHFKEATFYTAPIPTYIGGFMAFGWGSDKKYRIPEKILKQRLDQIEGTMKHYTPRLHRSSFSLPQYMLLEQ